MAFEHLGSFGLHSRPASKRQNRFTFSRKNVTSPSKIFGPYRFQFWIHFWEVPSLEFCYIGTKTLSLPSQKFSDLCYSNRLFFESILRSIPFLGSPKFCSNPSAFFGNKRFFIKMVLNLPFDLLFGLLQNIEHQSNPNKMNVLIKSLIQKNNH